MPEDYGDKTEAPTPKRRQKAREQGKMHFLMNLLKLCLVTLTAYSAIHGRLEQIVTVQQLSFIQIFGLGASIIYSIAIRIGILLLVLAIIDYFYQRFRIEKELKM